VVINNGTVFPPSGDAPTSPFDGAFNALMEPTSPAIAELYQTIALPTNAGMLTLSWADRIRNFGTNFATNQQFLVQIQDTNGTPLATAYASPPCGQLLNDWTQRSTNISSFAGRTVRVAFIVDASQAYLDVSLDDVSIRLANLPPVTYSVYFGTDAVPGSSDFLGTTTNTTWALPQLPPFTNYYWQVVAARSNQTAGPIWEFSTLPTLFINNVYLAANTNGVTNAVFTIDLAYATTNPVTVEFATSDGTAIATNDYAPTNGLLVFMPPLTNQTISIPVYFNTNLPGLKTFSLYLFDPTNAALAEIAGVATINETNPLAPVVAPISNITIHAEITLTFFASATNANHDPMRFSLDPGAPASASINSTNGLFTWTTTDSNVGSYPISVRATDTVNGLSGAWIFTVTVVPRPSFTYIHVSAGVVTMSWTAIPGDQYHLEYASNVTGPWNNLPGTVTATNNIATKTDSSGLFARRFYRVRVSP